MSTTGGNQSDPPASQLPRGAPSGKASDSEHPLYSIANLRDLRDDFKECLLDLLHTALTVAVNNNERFVNDEANHLIQLATEEVPRLWKDMDKLLLAPYQLIIAEQMVAHLEPLLNDAKANLEAARNNLLKLQDPQQSTKKEEDTSDLKGSLREETAATDGNPSATTNPGTENAVKTDKTVDEDTARQEDAAVHDDKHADTSSSEVEDDVKSVKTEKLE